MIELFVKYYGLAAAVLATIFTVLRLIDHVEKLGETKKTSFVTANEISRMLFVDDKMVSGFLLTVEKELMLRNIFRRSIPVEVAGPLMTLYNSGRITIYQIKKIWSYCRVSNNALEVRLSWFENLQATSSFLLSIICITIGSMMFYYGFFMLTFDPVIATQAIYVGLGSLALGIYLPVISSDLLVAQHVKNKLAGPNKALQPTLSRFAARVARTLRLRVTRRQTTTHVQGG